MLQNLWGLQALIILCTLLIILFICILTDLPAVLGLSFSKKETIVKYIEKKLIVKNKTERTICTFRMIGTQKNNDIEKVYIYMCICKYIKENRKLNIKNEEYKKGVAILTRKFGIFKVLGIELDENMNSDFFPAEIINTEDYLECLSNKERRFLKEANLKKAKKKFKLKKAFNI